MLTLEDITCQWQRQVTQRLQWTLILMGTMLQCRDENVEEEDKDQNKDKHDDREHLCSAHGTPCPVLSGGDIVMNMGEFLPLKSNRGDKFINKQFQLMPSGLFLITSDDRQFPLPTPSLRGINEIFLKEEFKLKYEMGMRFT